MHNLYDPKDRAKAVQKLIQLAGPLQSLVSELSSFPWDWIGEPLGIVSEADLAAAFDGCANGRLSTEMLFTWATALECRDDVGFANADVAAAIHELANPDLQPANFIDELESKFRR